MKADKKHILICGNYGAGNLGDEAILDGIIRLVESAWPGAVITVLGSDPANTRKTHNVQAVKMFPAGIRSIFSFWLRGWFVPSLHALKTADLVILGGGGLFTDEKWHAVIIWWVQTLWFRVFGKKYICLGQSVGPLRRQWARSLTKKVFRGAAYISVRDNGSRQVLERLGINKEVTVAPDAVFALTYDNDLPKNIQNQAVLSLRDWGDGKYSGFLKEVAELVDWLWTEKRMNTVFLPFQTRIDDDRAVYRRLKEQVRNKDCLVMKEVEDYKQAMEIIGRSKLIIGMRLHSLIFAAASSRPFVAISYSNKVRALVTDLGMEKYVVDYAQADFENLMELASDALYDADNLTHVLTKTKMKYTYQYFQQEKALQKVF